MKKTVLYISLLTLPITWLWGCVFPSEPKEKTTMKNFHEFTIEGLDSGQLNMSAFKGKYILVVNVASRCGYTGQYEGLQALYQKYKDKLVVIGLPCNQFAFQEPGDATDIRKFCSSKYQVTFPLTKKIDVKGNDQHPIYQWLTRKELNGVQDAEVKWNFNKFLISPEGKWLAYFPSKTEPMSDDITSLLK